MTIPGFPASEKLWHWMASKLMKAGPQPRLPEVRLVG
jgi:hypothetical protein